MILPGFNRSIPVMAGIQESKTKTGGESLIVQMVRQAGKGVEMMGKPAVLLPDACFFSKTTLMPAACYIGRDGQALLSVIARAKYARRFKTEGLFGELKNRPGGLCIPLPDVFA
jgi:hypothetical protein